VAESALFAFVVCADVPGAASESILEISADRIPTHDENEKQLDLKAQIKVACGCAKVDLIERFGAELGAKVKVNRVYQVDLLKELVYGDPTEEDLAEEAELAAANAAAEAKSKGKGKQNGKT